MSSHTDTHTHWKMRGCICVCVCVIEKAHLNVKCHELNNQVSPSRLIVDTKGRGSITGTQRERESGHDGGSRFISAPPDRAKWAVLEFPRGLDDIIHCCSPRRFTHYSSLHTHTSLARPSFCSNLTLEGFVQTIKLKWRTHTCGHTAIHSYHNLPVGGVFLLDTATEAAWALHYKYWMHKDLKHRL